MQFLCFLFHQVSAFSNMGSRKGIRRPDCKKLSGGVLAWLFVLRQGSDLHMAQLIPLPLTLSCFSKIQIGYYYYYYYY